MSLPVSACLLSKACTSELAYQRILTRLRFNAQCGQFALWPCHHQPRCPMPTVAQRATLVQRLKADLKSIS